MTQPFLLSPIQPYRFDLILKLIARYTHPVVDHVVLDAGIPRYMRALRDSNGNLSLWGVQQRADGDVEARLLTQTGEVDIPAALHQLAYVLALDVDTRPFFAYARDIAADEPVLWSMVEPLQGMRWLRTPTVFEAVVAVIIEQHIAWVAAQRSQQALVAWADNAITYQGRTYYVYPTPAQLAAATPDDLPDVKITSIRKRLLIGLATQVASGALPLEALRTLPAREAYDALMALRGIGHWSAAFIVARTHGAYAFIPDADVALQAAANHYFYGAAGKLTAAQTRALYQRYGEFAGSAAFFTLMRRVIDKYAEIV
jgi:DNA-3-methyladenine glycosylase II